MWIHAHGTAKTLHEVGFLVREQGAIGCARRLLIREVPARLHGELPDGQRAEGLARLVMYDAARERIYIEPLERGSPEERTALATLGALHLLGQEPPSRRDLGSPAPPRPKPRPVRSCPACALADNEKPLQSDIAFLYALAEVRTDGVASVVADLCARHRLHLDACDTAVACADAECAERESVRRS